MHFAADYKPEFLSLISENVTFWESSVENGSYWSLPGNINPGVFSFSSADWVEAESTSVVLGMGACCIIVGVILLRRYVVLQRDFLGKDKL
jgi:hypothetical protein